MRAGKASQRRSVPRWRAVAINLSLVVGILYALSFVPPDNSLAEVQRSGVLRVCLPETAPPLVTADAERPGYDVELLQQVAQDLGVRLAVNHNPAIGADFNPRNWRLTRAQCQIIAGGIVNNETTRGFLQLLPTGGRNGWARLAPIGTLARAIDSVLVFPGPAALDRLALSRYLRIHKLSWTAADSASALQDGNGHTNLLVSDWLTLAALDLSDHEINWLSETELPPVPLAWGLWKGDTTLLRALQDGLNKLTISGRKNDIASRYHLPYSAD